MIYSLAAGAVFALAPMLIERLSDADLWGNVAASLMLPGGAVALVVAGGIVHWMAWQVIVVSNFVFYSGLVYLVLSMRAKFLNKRRNASAGANSGG